MTIHPTSRTIESRRWRSYPDNAMTWGVAPCWYRLGLWPITKLGRVARRAANVVTSSGTGVPPVRFREISLYGNRNTRAGRPCHYSGARGATRPTSAPFANPGCSKTELRPVGAGVFDASQIIFETAWAALPGCALARRREILQALRVKISGRHPAWKNIQAQLALLEALERLQAEEPFAARMKDDL